MKTLSFRKRFLRYMWFNYQIGHMDYDVGRMYSYLLQDLHRIENIEHLAHLFKK